MKQIREDITDTYWAGLTETERENAFYAVMKRVFKASTEGGSYRYGLYDVFKFGGHMYEEGMDCGYFAIHNALYGHLNDDGQVQESVVSSKELPQESAPVDTAEYIHRSPVPEESITAKTKTKTKTKTKGNKE